MTSKPTNSLRAVDSALNSLGGDAPDFPPISVGRLQARGMLCWRTVAGVLSNTRMAPS